MDNRRSNLQKCSYKENNKINYLNSEMTGITFSQRDENWRGRIKINNIEYKKEFSVKVHGYEEAKKKAIEFRKKLILQYENIVCKESENDIPKHQDYDRLKNEFENIMTKYANSFIWKE
jgi:hypothetical protein